MSDIKTYFILKPTEEPQGPFSMKGLILLHKKGDLSGGDLITSEEFPEPIAFEQLLNATTSPRQKTNLPPIRPRKRATLPAKKTTHPASGTTGTLDGTPSEIVPLPPVPSRDDASSFAPFPRGLVILLSILAIFLVIHANTVSSIFQPPANENNIADWMSRIDDINSTFIPALRVILAAAVPVFFTWFITAAANARKLTGGKFNISPLSMVATWLIPGYNLIAVYLQMRSLLRASINPASPPYTKHSIFVAIWWLFFILMLVFVYLLFRITPEDPATTAEYFTRLIQTDIVAIFAIVFTILLICLISKAQKDISMALHRLLPVVPVSPPQ